MLTLDFDRLGLRSGDRVLDVGAGLGRHSYEAFRRGAHIVALDLPSAFLPDVRDMFDALSSEERVNGARGDAITGNALTLPFADASFDRVIASEVLEHIPEDEAAMKEMARVTKPGGTIAITVPRTGQEVVCWALSREYHDTPGGHVRIYRRSQIVERLKGAGLKPTGFGYAHALHTPYWWLRCLVGPSNEKNLGVKTYKRFLEWDIMNAPKPLRAAERALNPVLGKSLVVYLRRPEESHAV